METVNSAKELLLSSSVTKHLPQGCEWWSKYIYHFSHITNIAYILNDDLLRSRNQVVKLKDENLNDNASGEVILGTEEMYKDYVRFYFRPLTPTQFHNEGIRASTQITALGAHCPVPVFLLFDTEILDEPNVFFSFESLASHYYVPLYQGVRSLANAPFHYIYHNESTYNLDGNQIRKHRQAEIVIKDQCNLHHLKRILCRTKAEADTLKSLLNFVAYSKYNDKICYIDQGVFDTGDINTIFHGDYLKILDIEQCKSHMLIQLNRNDYHPRNIQILWSDRGGNQICHFNKENYLINSNYFKITMNTFLDSHDFVNVMLKLDGHLVYCNDFYL
ncbi:DUF4433 domain-containing protein [Rossellomorea sp. SC111]|uniref:DUF4433 domain-containing protein n=1 Tax=Rossellomorea sp. SC111 TaxID=2968985 RepID=UPI00215A1150|nr:DUF4433 domain-containing protein [Rossellomorea sp. SC111]MCR8848155.1 DUF4433 domain-containing protein [Rossellomorea sp. SC111]